MGRKETEITSKAKKLVAKAKKAMAKPAAKPVTKTAAKPAPKKPAAKTSSPTSNGGPITWNFKLLSHHLLDGFGGMGEGMSIQIAPDGRRILWLAHESAPKNFTAVDVSDPRKPKVVVQTDLPQAHMRSNSLETCGNIMAVAYQTQKKGLQPAKAADKRTLIRRATYDLIGLPPTPEEVKAFLADESADAYANVVDRLLASPRYGERWGRHWLDVARYADSNGLDENLVYKNAFPPKSAFRPNSSAW